MMANLKPGQQCARAARTATDVLGQITSSFQYQDRHVFVQLYKQYVRPHLDFAVQAWSPWTEGNKEVLEKVQRKAVAMVAGLAGRTYKESLAELDMTTLGERRHQADMAQAFKILRGYERVDPGHWFQNVNSDGHKTRGVADPLNLVKKRHRLDIRRKKNFHSE